jgi:hypothetical protein
LCYIVITEFVKYTAVNFKSYFFNSLCNALDYVESGYGLELKTKKAEYEAAKEKLDAVSYEDVLMQILKDGGTLTMVDHECEGEYTRTITLADVHQRVKDTPIKHLMDMINENDDAVTGDVIIQQVFFEEVIFG